MSTRQIAPTLGVGLFFVSLLVVGLTAGCNGDAACSIDGDCFQGERCVDGTCEVGDGNDGTNNESGGASNSSTNGGSNNETNNDVDHSNNASNNIPNNETNNLPNSETNNLPNNETNNVSADCIVDLVGNQCDEDEYEENDGYQPGTSRYEDATVWESDSWCDGDGELVMPTRSVRGTLCAGDGGDAFRFVVANAGPVCITSDYTTFRITVDIETPCAAEFLRVEPYTFGLDPVRNDLCADDANVVCTTEDDGQKRIVEWVWPQEQYYDPRIQIMPEREDVQIDYEVTVEVLPQ